MEKEFKWSPDFGWSWHKTWNIPTITVTLAMLDKNTMQELECPNNIEVNLYAAKLVTNQSNLIYFSSIPLKGDTCYKFVEGRVTLEGIKFDTTSYNHNVLKVYEGQQVSSYAPHQLQGSNDHQWSPKNYIFTD